MAERCLHGLDPRFCANCNRATRGGASRPTVTLAQVIALLNSEQIRATYGAVGEAIGAPAQSVGSLLGERRPDASWIVNASNGLPSGYDAAECHSELLSHSEVIKTGRELLLRLALTQQKRS